MRKETKIRQSFVKLPPKQPSNTSIHQGKEKQLTPTKVIDLSRMSPGKDQSIRRAANDMESELLKTISSFKMTKKN